MRYLYAWALAMVVLVSGCASEGVGSDEAPPEPVLVREVMSEVAPDSPQAFHGLGRLAFVRDGRLYLLDGETDVLREVEGTGTAYSPAWSADGRWLAFFRSEGERSRLVLVEADTAQVRELTALPGPVTGYAWAPAGSGLAVGVALADEAWADGARPAESGEIWLVEEPSSPAPRRLAALDTPAGSLSWSPDGSRIAYVTTLPYHQVEQRSDALEEIPAGGGEPVRWYVADRSGIDLAGWWPDGRGILFWVRPMHSNSIGADGLPLRSLALGAQEPVSLPTTLLYRDWLAWSPGGRELLLVRGGGRPVWDGKGLAVCDVATGACRDLEQPAEAVHLDPAWSADGSRIAFVRVDRRPGAWGFDSEQAVREWVLSRTLWLAGPDGSDPREVPAAGRGIYNPAWSADGRHLLYIREGAIWVFDLAQGKANRVGTLGEPESLVGFYGRLGWSSRIAWYRGSR